MELRAPLKRLMTALIMQNPAGKVPETVADDSVACLMHGIEHQIVNEWSTASAKRLHFCCTATPQPLHRSISKEAQEGQSRSGHNQQSALYAQLIHVKSYSHTRVRCPGGRCVHNTHVQCAKAPVGGASSAPSNHWRTMSCLVP